MRGTSDIRVVWFLPLIGTIAGELEGDCLRSVLLLLLLLDSLLLEEIGGCG